MIRLIEMFKEKMRIGSKGFTLIEVMMALALLGIVGLMSIQIINATFLTTRMSLDGYKMRSKMYENTSFMIREVQSSDSVKVEDSGKTLRISYEDGRGDVVYSVVVREGEGFMDVNGKETFKINAEKSSFEVLGTLVGVDLWVRGNVEGKGKREHNYKTKILMRKQ